MCIRDSPWQNHAMTEEWKWRSHRWQVISPFWVDFRNICRWICVSSRYGILFTLLHYVVLLKLFIFMANFYANVYLCRSMLHSWSLVGERRHPIKDCQSVFLMYNFYFIYGVKLILLCATSIKIRKKLKVAWLMKLSKVNCLHIWLSYVMLAISFNNTW